MVRKKNPPTLFRQSSDYELHTQRSTESVQSADLSIWDKSENALNAGSSK